MYPGILKRIKLTLIGLEPHENQNYLLGPMKTLWIRAYILFSSALQSGSVYRKDQNSVTVETFCLFFDYH